MEWSESAKKSFEKHTQRIKSQLIELGVDESEVVEDIKRHIEEEITAQKLPLVTEEDVDHLIKKFHPSNKDEKCRTASVRISVKLDFPWFFFFGVLAPFLFIVWVFITHPSAVFTENIFYTIAAFLLPTTNLFLWKTIKNRSSKFEAFWGWCNAIGMGIYGTCAVIFVPVIIYTFLKEFATIGLVLTKTDCIFLPLIPITLATIAGIKLRLNYQILHDKKMPGFWPGIIIGALVFLFMLSITFSQAEAIFHRY
jgi:hypothetical protein